MDEIDFSGFIASNNYHDYLSTLVRRTPEVRRILSLQKLGENNPSFKARGKNHWNVDKPLSEEHKEKIRQTLVSLGLWVECEDGTIRGSEELGKRISEGLTGRHLSEDHKKKLSTAFSGENHYLWGKHLSAERKQRLSIINTGKRQSEETRNRRSESMSGEKNPNFGKPLPAEHNKKLQTGRADYWVMKKAGVWFLSLD